MSHWRIETDDLQHALTRFREHHGSATRGDLLLAVGEGEEIAVETAAPLCGRTVDRMGAGDRFVLSPDRKGMFVLEQAGPERYRIATYLRFGPGQTEFAVRWWPRESARGLETPENPSPLAGKALVYALARAASETRRKPRTEDEKPRRRRRPEPSPVEEESSHENPETFPARWVVPPPANGVAVLRRGLPRADTAETPRIRTRRLVALPTPPRSPALFPSTACTVRELLGSTSTRELEVEDDLLEALRGPERAHRAVGRGRVCYQEQHPDRRRVIACCIDATGRTLTVEVVVTDRVGVVRWVRD